MSGFTYVRDEKADSGGKPPEGSGGTKPEDEVAPQRSVT